ncbi:multi antimicrobial extrusion (MATE) family transporter [Streptococcus parauberis]|uniref:MATE family efflux transporter n=2 Tax=Streptococcus parauberis TaxID=1348 RepID=UPI0004490260|nr:MATE family efflux transporter [Streptococcus parauberis]GAJ62031.1 multi antimicrobial extrusion (MATE) family transporter [Streptococcus parauberis]
MRGPLVSFIDGIMQNENRRNILNIALPAMAENFLQMLMGFVDNYLVAQVSLVAVSGVSLANNLITVYQALFIALGSAVSSLLARSLGKKDQLQSQKLMADAITLTLVVSLALGILTVLAKSWLLTLFGAEAQVVAVGGSYLSVVGGLVSSLAMMTSLGAILRATGQTRIPMWVSLFANLLNGLMSASSVFLFHWGVVGVAWSTVLARLIGILLLLYFLPVRIIISNINFRMNLEILGLAMPSAGERLMMRLGDLLIMTIIVSYGTSVYAGNAIGETISQFTYMPGMAVATATIIGVAGLLGKENPIEVNKYIKEAFMLSTILMLIFSILIYISGNWLSGQFTTNVIAIKSSLVVLLFSLLGTPFTSGTLIYTAVWQGLGNAKIPFYATTLGMWIIRILGGFILGSVIGLGLSGVWIATVLDNMTRFLLLKSLYKKYKNL